MVAFGKHNQFTCCFGAINYIQSLLCSDYQIALLRHAKFFLDKVSPTKC